MLRIGETPEPNKLFISMQIKPEHKKKLRNCDCCDNEWGCEDQVTIPPKQKNSFCTFRRDSNSKMGGFDEPFLMPLTGDMGFLGCFFAY